MMRISEKGKAKQKRGTGDKQNYIPYIQSYEFNSLGTTSNPIDWKTGRTVELLSQGESILWHILRWDDDIEDIKEQYPLELDITVEIAKKYHIKHPNNNRTRMTTDFLVIFKDGSKKAISLKNSKKDVKDNKRTLEKLFIEKRYWVEYKNVDFKLLFAEDLNVIEYQNIRTVVPYFDSNKVFNETSYLQHLIATKKIDVDMTSEIINFKTLAKKLEVNYE